MQRIDVVDISADDHAGHGRGAQCPIVFVLPVGFFVSIDVDAHRSSLNSALCTDGNAIQAGVCCPPLKMAQNAHANNTAAAASPPYTGRLLIGGEAQRPRRSLPREPPYPAKECQPYSVQECQPCSAQPRRGLVGGRTAIVWLRLRGSRAGWRDRPSGGAFGVRRLVTARLFGTGLFGGRLVGRFVAGRFVRGGRLVARFVGACFVGACFVGAAAPVVGVPANGKNELARFIVSGSSLASSSRCSLAFGSGQARR